MKKVKSEVNSSQSDPIESDKTIYPTFEISERSEKRLKKALANRDKAVTVGDIKKYFRDL